MVPGHVHKVVALQQLVAEPAHQAGPFSIHLYLNTFS